MQKLLIQLSDLKNLQVFATISSPFNAPEGFDLIELGSIDPRLVLKRRLEFLSEGREKSDVIVSKAMQAVDIVTKQYKSDLTPREAIQAVVDLMRVWDSEHTLTKSPPSESIIIWKLHNYLKNRVDYIGVIVAVGIYFLSLTSDLKHEKSEDMRYEKLIKQISLLVEQKGQPHIQYFSNSRLNLRSGPNKDFSILTVLETGEELSLLETNGLWMHVKVKETSKTGWVYAQYVTPVIEMKSSNNIV